MKTFSLTSIAVLSLIAMSGAHAGDVPTLTVKYADLDQIGRASCRERV